MNKRIIPIIFLTFVNVLGFAVVIPVLPFLVEDFGGNNITYGILLALYPFCQFFGAPVLGTLSDKYGRRPILLITQLGTLLSWVIFSLSYFVPPIRIGALALPLFVIGFGRIVDGITGGNFSVANAYVSDIIPPKKRTSVFGIMGAAIGIALIVGPAVGGYLLTTSLGYLSVGIFAFIVSLITLSLMYTLLPESLAQKNRNQHTNFNIFDEINVYKKLKTFSNPAVKKLFFMRSFFALTFSSYTSTVVLFMKDILALAPERIGLMFLVLGSFFIFNQAVATPYLAKRFGDLKAFMIGQVLMMIGLSILVFIKVAPIFLINAYLINLGFSSSFPTFKSIITKLVSKKRQGEITGLDESVLAGASAIAPLTASVLYESFGAWAYGMFGLLAMFPYVVFFLRSGSVRIDIGE